MALEIRDATGWRTVGLLRLLEAETLGLNAHTEFVYDLDYAALYTDKRDAHAVSCAVPVSFEPQAFAGWPPFVLDLFPQGAALKYVVDHYRIADRPENYWRILTVARLNPPGNVRILVPDSEAPERATKLDGFTMAAVVSKGPDFLAHMIRCGAPVAGSTGAGGAAPKFLLREDHAGYFHADGTLPDAKTRACWLVKFPRGANADDRAILYAEAAFAKIARHVGLDVHELPTWEGDCLFVPRFDRQIAGKELKYYGLESFYSLAGKAEFGSRHEHETYLQALSAASTQPVIDVIEYVLRDFFNVMIGNTDNHGRNSSVLKGPGWIHLAPLYDVAPMKFDPEGIVRNTNWGPQAAHGDLAGIALYLRRHQGLDEAMWHTRLKAFHEKTATLEQQLRAEGVDERFIKGTADDRAHQHDAIGRYLAAVR